MAPKRKMPQAKPADKEYGTRRMIDRGSFLAGAVAGSLIIALIVLAYVFSQQAPQQITAVRTPAPQAPEKPKYTGGLQVTIRNNENRRIVINSVQGGDNLSSTLLPGEVKNATVAVPRGCGADISQCRGEIAVTYVPIYDQGGNGASQGGSGTANGTQGGGSGNGTGGIGGAGTGGGTGLPLSISTSSLAFAVQDAKYSFALEAQGGTGNYYWSATGFPPGLSMAAGGLISGAALRKGTFNIQVVLADGASTVVNDMTLVVI